MAWTTNTSHILPTQVVNESDDELLTIDQVSDVTHYSVGTVRRYVRNGAMPQPVKLYRNVRWSKNAIQRWIHDCTTKANQ